jgi:hypothetical protein
VHGEISGRFERDACGHDASAAWGEGVDGDAVAPLLSRGRQGQKQTLANLSRLPDELVELIRRYLRGERFVAGGELEIRRSLPAGHVNAVLAMARRLDLARLLDRAPSRERDLALALIVGRVLEPSSKLGLARSLGRSTLAAELGVEGADEDDLYAALDWLGERQERIEARWHAGTWPTVIWSSMTCPRASYFPRINGGVEGRR